MTFTGWGLASLAPLFGGGVAAITALYLLRTRKRELIVPFAALWTQVTQESDARRLWRRFRRWISWLVQVLLLALVCAALSDPRPQAWLGDPVTLAVVLDRSASMAGASEQGMTRLQHGVKRAQQELAALGPSDRAVIIAAGLQTEVLAPLSADRETWYHALAQVAPSPGEADLAAALALARHSVAEAPGGRILVLTDGALDPPAWDALDGCIAAPLPCGVAAVTGPTNNLAITAFAARRYPQAQDKIEVLVEVRNLGDAPATAELDIQAEGASLGRRTLDLAPGGITREILPDLDAARTRLTAQLRAPSGVTLGPAIDDTAFAVVPPLDPLHVLVVTDGTDLFLEAALLSQGDRIELTGMTAEQVQAGGPDLADTDVVIIDVADTAAPSFDALPTAHVIWFDPWRGDNPGFPIARKAEVRRPFITEQRTDHPVGAHALLKDVNLSRGITFVPQSGDEILVRSLGDPLVVLRERDDVSVLAIGFDPRQSDLPLRPAFAVLLDDALTYFANRRPGFVAALGVARQQSVALADVGLVSEGADHVRVTDPQGRQQDLPIDGGHIVVPTPIPGFYDLRSVGGSGGDAAIAVSATDPEASDLRPRHPDRLQQADAGPAPAPAPGVSGPLWTLLVGLAGLLLVLEWGAYHRRVTV